MHLLDLTLGTPEENLALDEALLELAEVADQPQETLRLWEPTAPMVVVGRSSQLDLEVKLDVCRERDIPVLRRASGGAAIVAARGCLMYAVVLSYESRPELRSVDLAHQFVLDTTLKSIRPLVLDVVRRGTSDLALGDLKFSGNSLRCKRRGVLYHGTLLYNFTLPLVDELLKMPPRQPEYRQGRPHSAFVTNLPVSSEQLRRGLIDAWQANESSDWPRELVENLVATRYSQPAWNAKL